MELTASHIANTWETLRRLSQERLQVPACSIDCIGKAFGGHFYQAILRSIGFGKGEERMPRNLSRELVWNQVNQTIGHRVFPPKDRWDVVLWTG